MHRRHATADVFTTTPLSGNPVAVVLDADVVAPQFLARLATVDRERAAACLSVNVDDVRCTAHRPQVLSVGLPFLVVELASRAAVTRCRPD